MTGTALPGAGCAVELGIYEKALDTSAGLEALFTQAREGGFAFVDLSVDESEERMARLDWTPDQRRTVREAAARAGVALGGLCLSVHRRIAPGSNDPGMRQEAVDVLLKGIDLCADLGIPVLQLAGYYAYYEAPPKDARDGYVDCLRKGAAHAARRGVLLGIENVDGADITSISRALEVVDEVGSPWLQLYPDIGNLAEQGLDSVSELSRGAGHMLALHVKDVRRGEPRRVPMGQGIVDWDEAFRELVRQEWNGRVMVEMWNDDAPDSLTHATAARDFIAEALRLAGATVAGPAGR